MACRRFSLSLGSVVLTGGGGAVPPFTGALDAAFSGSPPPSLYPGDCIGEVGFAAPVFSDVAAPGC